MVLSAVVIHATESQGIAVLGGVFLAMTGGEAMFADMGHIGRNPIRTF
jgi:KUP system potassium uptake protein